MQVREPFQARRAKEQTSPCSRSVLGESRLPWAWFWTPMPGATTSNINWMERCMQLVRKHSISSIFAWQLSDLETGGSNTALAAPAPVEHSWQILFARQEFSGCQFLPVLQPSTPTESALWKRRMSSHWLKLKAEVATNASSDQRKQ